jgi:hypothetical protein
MISGNLTLNAGSVGYSASSGVISQSLGAKGSAEISISKAMPALARILTQVKNGKDAISISPPTKASGASINVSNQFEGCKTPRLIEYKGGAFFGTVYPDGKPCNGEALEIEIGNNRTFTGSIDKGALVADGGTRLQREGVNTPFQDMLASNDIQWDGIDIGTWSSADESIRRTILNYDKKFAIIPDEKLKLDINNDNARRVFDTVFAKKMLESLLGNEGKIAAIREVSDDIFNIHKTRFLPHVMEDWKAACDGSYRGKDGRLQQLTTQKTRLREAVDALDIQVNNDVGNSAVNAAKDFIATLYERRYLNYLIDEIDEYSKKHPLPISKSGDNPLYRKGAQLRGDMSRIESGHMGILRSVDKAPANLQFHKQTVRHEGIEPALYTRCPDRFNLAKPDSLVNKDGDSWMSHVMFQGNTPVVNGLSGSMLIEIGNMCFLKERLKEGAPENDFLSGEGVLDVLDDYFKTTAAMFTYIDGGHSLFEIQWSFKQPWIDNLFAVSFGEPANRIGQDLYGDKVIFAETFKETKDFYLATKAKKAVNASIAGRFVTQAVAEPDGHKFAGQARDMPMAS